MSKKNVLLAVAGAAVAMTSMAQAGITGDPLTITATRGSFTSTFTLGLNDGSWNTDQSVWTYNGVSGQTIQMRDTRPGMGNALVAELDMTFFAVQFVSDPQVNLNFNTTNPDANNPLNVTVTSALLTFPAISNALATASSGLTLRDRGGVGVGATATGNQPGGNTYHSEYNGGTTFANLVPGFSVPTFTQQTQNGSVGSTPIGTVSSMQAQWAFTLSPFDAATGTSTYVVTPTPGALALLGLGGLVAGRRRR